jgi:hypothetical protein
LPYHSEKNPKRSGIFASQGDLYPENKYQEEQEWENKSCKQSRAAL